MPEKDLFGDENQAACKTCTVIHPTAAKAAECERQHVLESGRERCRRFARTGVSQVKKDGGGK